MLHQFCLQIQLDSDNLLGPFESQAGSGNYLVHTQNSVHGLVQKELVRLISILYIST